jgi:hypothetical protein
MIIDCDTHIMPSDAFSHVGASFADKAPRLELDDRGCVVNIEFPANPAHVPGTTPLPANHPSLNYGAGALRHRRQTQGLPDDGRRLAPCPAAARRMVVLSH